MLRASRSFHGKPDPRPSQSIRARRMPSEGVSSHGKTRVANGRIPGNSKQGHEVHGQGGNAMPAGRLDEVIRHLRRAALARGGAEPCDAELVEQFVRRRDEAAFEALV